MSLFAVICHDKPDHLEVRKANRDAHLAYLEATGVVKQAGPFLNAAGEMYGSLLVIDVADRAAAEAWAKSDPYAVADLFSSVAIEQWNRVIG